MYSKGWRLLTSTFMWCILQAVMLRIKAISYDLYKPLELLKFRQIHSSDHVTCTIKCTSIVEIFFSLPCINLLVCQMYTDCSFFIKAHSDLDSQDFLSFLEILFNVIIIIIVKTERISWNWYQGCFKPNRFKCLFFVMCNLCSWLLFVIHFVFIHETATEWYLLLCPCMVDFTWHFLTEITDHV